MWGQLIIALACALEILAQDCVIPTGPHFNRASYLRYRGPIASGKTHYNASERLPHGIWIRVVCNKDRQGDAVLNKSNHECSAGKWTPGLPDCREILQHKRCGAPPKVEYALASERITTNKTFPHQTVVSYKCKAGFDKLGTTSNVTCVDGEWTLADIICATTTTAKTTTTRTTTTPITSTFPIQITTSTTTGTPTTTTIPITTTSPETTTTSTKITTPATASTQTTTTTPRPTTATTATATATHMATSEKKENTEITTKKTMCSPECQNGGTCVSPGKCRCRDGFDGLHCENDIDECSKSDLNDCHHFSNCTNTPGNYTCKCTDGYVDLDDNRGRRCEALCTPECQNGGTCVSTDVCNCPDRFRGKQCENALCNSECQNGGKCVSPDRCQCPEGYNGLRCENDYKPVLKNGIDATRYAIYSCKCSQTTGRLQCMVTEVECKPIGCKIPANVQQGMTLFDPKERQFITAANHSEIQHGQCLTFTCEQSDVFYFEPNRRMFECVNGSWVAKKRSHVDTWDLGNNGSFPECRKVVCQEDYCKFGGQCIRDHECKCPEQTSGNQCQTPLCSPECQNGTCVSPGECHCLDGFDGLHCENALCNPECQNGGTCVSPYRCLCPDGFHGPSCENETKNCTLEAGQNVNYWHMSTNTTLSEGGKVVHGTRIRVKCQNTGFDYSDYYNNDESPANIECVNGEFTDHGLKCESETKSTPDSSPSTKNCTTIENGKITDRGKSFTCNADYQPSFKNGMDAILYARYSCTCNKRTGNVQCMGTEVECKPIGCKIPANVQQGMTLFDPKERRTISAANRYEIQHGQFLTFTCEPSDVFYFEPHRRIFECVKGLWVSKTRPHVDTWDFGNNGSFPECRKVVCPADYCKFGGHCIRDHECQCPEQTSGKQCETPLCSPGCQNGGTCVLPDTCRCLDGFYGLHCENDIDECSRSDLNDCHEYSNCTNIPGSFTCKCNKGYVDHGGNSGRKCAETCDASDIWTERSTCDAAYCLDENKNRVCTQGNWTVTNLCLKGKRMCSTNESLVNGNSNVSVSSQYYDPNFPNESEMFGADQGRLNSQEKGAYATPSFRAGIWAAGVDDRNPFIQVNFTVPKTITGIVTRGRPKSKYQDDPQWVTQYRFLYSTDCKTFETYNETNGVVKIFSANVNGDQTVPKILPCPVVALCARVNPTKCHGYCSMQFDIMGCNSS